MKDALRPLLAVAIVACLFASIERATAAQTPSTFADPPPGTILKRVPVYLRGEAMNSQYIAVASRVFLPGGATMNMQPYLSIYAKSDIGFTLVYRSPGPTDSLHIVPRVRRPPGSPIAFPHTSLSIVGAAEFMQPAVQQLVVTVNAYSADCGATDVYVLGMNAGGIVERAAFHNPCSLSARIKPGPSDKPASLVLSGPHYAKDAALCCPTKPHASATAKWAHNSWTVTPPYFAVSHAPSNAVPASSAAHRAPYSTAVAFRSTPVAAKFTSMQHREIAAGQAASTPADRLHLIVSLERSDAQERARCTSFR